MRQARISENSERQLRHWVIAELFLWILLLSYWIWILHQPAQPSVGLNTLGAGAVKYDTTLLEQINPARFHYVGRSPTIMTILLFLGLASGTLLSEDLTCIAAGVMIADGRISFLFGSFACFFGIYGGDLLLYWVGRILGRPALRRAPIKWLIREEEVQKSSAWFTCQGIKVILVSRFIPGTRLPTYFAAGLLATNFWRFALYFLFASLLWTPLLVGAAAGLGGEVTRSAVFMGNHIALKFLMVGGGMFLTIRVLLSLMSFKGRRLWISRWRRITHWEFWPPWIFYVPVVCSIGFLALKHRSLTLFTAANPVMPAGGFVGESKMDILRGLSGANEFVARATAIKVSANLEARMDQARSFMAHHGLGFPIVLKPDAGQRGSGVAIVRSDTELEEFLRGARSKTIIQEYVPGFEFGVFYYRYPDSARGRIFSITEKHFPTVTGDGKSTLEHLILEDARAVCMAHFFFKKHARRLWEVIEPGEALQLVELGTHCRGALFLDGDWVKTEALEQAIDTISKTYEGFYFGRFDIRVPSVEDFRKGRNFKIMELNGVTSEATHIYDPDTTLAKAYRVLFQQWRIAFEIGAQNRACDVRPTSLSKLMRLVLDFKRSRVPPMFKTENANASSICLDDHSL